MVSTIFTLMFSTIFTPSSHHFHTFMFSTIFIPLCFPPFLYLYVFHHFYTFIKKLKWKSFFPESEPFTSTLFRPDTRFWGHMQTVQTQFRCHRKSVLSGSTLFACRNFNAKYSKNENTCQKPLKLEMDSARW